MQETKFDNILDKKNYKIHHCARPSPFATARPPAATVPFAPQIPVNLPPPPQVAAKFNPE